MDNFDNEFNKVIEQINSDFENIVGQSIENSVNKEPVKYKKNLTILSYMTGRPFHIGFSVSFLPAVGR